MLEAAAVLIFDYEMRTRNAPSTGDGPFFCLTPIRKVGFHAIPQNPERLSFAGMAKRWPAPTAPLTHEIPSVAGVQHERDSITLETKGLRTDVEIAEEIARMFSTHVRLDSACISTHGTTFFLSAAVGVLFGCISACCDAGINPIGALGNE